MQGSMVASTEGEDRMASGTFLVSVSLERFFSDERARCYMAVDGSRRTRWLARRLRRTFALPGRVALLCRGHLLPPGEPLALLRHGDELEAIPATAHVVDISRDATPEDYEESRAPHHSHHSPQLPPPVATEQLQSLDEMKKRALALLALHEPHQHLQHEENAQHEEPEQHEEQKQQENQQKLEKQVHDENQREEEHQQCAGGRVIRRRRRVRRRRVPRSASELPETETETEPMQVETETKEEICSEGDLAHLSTDMTDAVIRNSCGGQRTARRVSALAQ